MLTGKHGSGNARCPGVAVVVFMVIQDKAKMLIPVTGIADRNLLTVDRNLAMVDRNLAMVNKNLAIADRSLLTVDEKMKDGVCSVYISKKQEQERQ